MAIDESFFKFPLSAKKDSWGTIDPGLFKKLRKPPSGFLAAFEGVDGSGKSTQAALLKERLLAFGKDAVLFREPTSDSMYGKTLRSLPAGSRLDPQDEYKLFLYDRGYDVENNILPSLQAGRIVIMDRYIVSSISYQGALGILLEAIFLSNMPFPWPDVTIVLDTGLSEAERRLLSRKEARKDKDKERGHLWPESQKELLAIDKDFEDAAYQARVKAILDSLALPSMVRVDGSKDKESLSEEILGIVLDSLEKKRAAARGE